MITRVMSRKIAECSLEKLAKIFISMVSRYVQATLSAETASINICTKWFSISSVICVMRRKVT